MNEYSCDSSSNTYCQSIESNSSSSHVNNNEEILTSNSKSLVRSKNKNMNDKKVKLCLRVCLFFQVIIIGFILIFFVILLLFLSKENVSISSDKTYLFYENNIFDGMMLKKGILLSNDFKNDLYLWYDHNKKISTHIALVDENKKIEFLGGPLEYKLYDNEQLFHCSVECLTHVDEAEIEYWDEMFVFIATKSLIAVVSVVEKYFRNMCVIEETMEISEYRGLRCRYAS